MKNTQQNMIYQKLQNSRTSLNITMTFGVVGDSIYCHEKKKIIVPNNAYSLWRVHGCQHGFRSVANFGFGGQENASKPPQAICKPLALRGGNQSLQKQPIPTKPLRELLHAHRDDAEAFPELLLGDHQGWCETDDVTVGGFGQEAVVAEQQAELPGGFR